MRTRTTIRWAGLLLCVGALPLFGLLAIQKSISRGVDGFAAEAQARYSTDRVSALISLVDCDACLISDRNHAVWALGQMREKRALAVIRKYQTGRPCNHQSELCQKEIGNAISAIERRYPIWLGYRGKPGS
jgi:hypothetical protein